MEYHLRTPVPKDIARELKMGDVVYVSGTMITARDKAHMRMAEYFSSNKKLPFALKDAVIFHGAPIVQKEGDAWKIVAIGPTTSARMDAQEPVVIEHGASLIVGKGGMDRRTLAALHEWGAAYCSMTGGTAVLGARMVKKVQGVEWMDLGLAEAVWVLQVDDFGPLMVTMDAHMGDLHEEVRRRVSEKVKGMGV